MGVAGGFEEVDHNSFSAFSQICVDILQTTAGQPNPSSFYIAKDLCSIRAIHQQPLVNLCVFNDRFENTV